MANFKKGYQMGAKMARELDAGLVKKAAVKKQTPKPKAPVGIPLAGSQPGLANGGAARKYADGGKVMNNETADAINERRGRLPSFNMRDLQNFAAGDEEMAKRSSRQLESKDLNPKTRNYYVETGKMLDERAKITRDEIRKRRDAGYAKGGKVEKADERKELSADKKQDKAMIARHNRLMHAGQKSKLKTGGKVKSGKGC